MTIKFIENKIYNQEKLIYTFDFPIKQVVEFEDCFIVLLKRGKNIPINNVFGLNTQGDILWQFKKDSSLKSSFVELKRDDKNVALLNFDGTKISVVPLTGERLLKISNKRPW